jgi:hypothetical protein
MASLISKEMRIRMKVNNTLISLLLLSSVFGFGVAQAADNTPTTLKDARGDRTEYSPLP